MRPRIQDYPWEKDLEVLHAHVHPPTWLGVLLLIMIFVLGGLSFACAERLFF